MSAVLVLAFVAVAVLAVSFAAVLSSVLSERGITELEQQRRDSLVRSLTAGAASSYHTGRPGWGDVDLTPILVLAASTGTDATVLDQAGGVVATTDPDTDPHSSRVVNPIEVGGSRVGSVVVQFPDRGVVAAVQDLRGSVAQAVIGAAGLALLVALVVALVVSRLISRPVTLLIGASRARASGNMAARVGAIRRAPAELIELGATFDTMADTLDGQEQLRRELVTDVAHELRTPLAVLQANIEAIQDGIVQDSPEQKELLHGEVLRLSRIVDDLQTLADAKAAAIHLDIQLCDLEIVAGTVTGVWEHRFIAAGINLERHLDHAVVDGDPNRLHQLIANLLSNALKHTPSGGTVTISVDRHEGYGRVRVDDSGPGIGAKDQPHVFDRLWRGSGQTSASGAGVGLAIVAELARAHRGWVEVSSELGQGSTFTALIPLAS